MIAAFVANWGVEWVFRRCGATDPREVAKAEKKAERAAKAARKAAKKKAKKKEKAKARQRAEGQTPTTSRVTTRTTTSGPTTRTASRTTSAPTSGPTSRTMSRSRSGSRSLSRSLSLSASATASFSTGPLTPADDAHDPFDTPHLVPGPRMWHVNTDPDYVPPPPPTFPRHRWPAAALPPPETWAAKLAWAARGASMAVGRTAAYEACHSSSTPCLASPHCLGDGSLPKRRVLPEAEPDAVDTALAVYDRARELHAIVLRRLEAPPRRPWVVVERVVEVALVEAEAFMGSVDNDELRAFVANAFAHALGEETEMIAEERVEAYVAASASLRPGEIAWPGPAVVPTRMG